MRLVHPVCRRCNRRWQQDGTGLCRACGRETGEYQLDCREAGAERIARKEERHARNGHRVPPAELLPRPDRIVVIAGWQYSVVWDGS